jgi:hypothetical protein
MTQKEKEAKLVMDLAEDLAPFVKDTENSIKTTKNHYGKYGAMLSKLSKGNKKVATILAYAMIQAGANNQGVSDALNVFFPEN